MLSVWLSFGASLCSQGVTKLQLESVVPRMEEDKRSASVGEYMYMYNHPPSSTGLSHFGMKSALVCGSIQRTGQSLFVPLSMLVTYS